MTALCQFEGCFSPDDPNSVVHQPCGCHAFVAASPAAEEILDPAWDGGYRAGLLRAAEIAEGCTARAEEEPENNGFLSAMEHIAALIRAEAEVKE